MMNDQVSMVEMVSGLGTPRERSYGTYPVYGVHTYKGIGRDGEDRTFAYLPSRRVWGNEVHLSSTEIKNDKAVSFANTTVCNGRSGSNVRYTKEAPTCEKCLARIR